MNIAAMADAARKAAAEAARRAAEAARKAAEAAARKAAEAAQQAAEARMAQQQVKVPLDVKKAVTKDLGEAAKQLAGPEAFDSVVNQAENKLTCGAANKQMAMKEKNPAEHDRIVKDLKETGEAKMPNGEKLVLSDENAGYIDKQEIPEADKDNMRMQAALMDYANGDEKYDMATDISKGPDGSASKGLSTDELANLDKLDDTSMTVDAKSAESAASVEVIVSAVTSIFGFKEKKSHDEVLADNIGEKLEQAEDQNANLAISIELEGGDHKHAVTVVEVDDKADTVTVKDTEGTYELTNEEFDEAVNSEEKDAGNYANQSGTSGGAAQPSRPGGRAPRGSYIQP